MVQSAIIQWSKGVPLFQAGRVDSVLSHNFEGGTGQTLAGTPIFADWRTINALCC